MQKSLLKAAIGVAGMLVALVAVSYVPVPWGTLGLWGYPGLLIGCAVGGLGAFAPSPALGLVVSAGRTLDPVLVGVFAGAGFALGEVPLYLAMRSNTAHRVIPSWLFPARLERWFKRLEGSALWWPAILLLAVVPTPLFDCVTIFCGRWNVAPHRFVVPIALGRVLRCVLVAESAASFGR